MPFRNPHHPQALRREDLRIDDEVLWCAQSGRISVRLIIAGEPYCETNPQLRVAVISPVPHRRTYELFHMGIISGPSGWWAPSFTIPAELEHTLPPPRPRRRFADFDLQAAAANIGG